MKSLPRTFWILVGLAWVSVNVWAWLPVHSADGLTAGLLIGVVVANPILFSLMGYLGQMRRDALMVVWPILVIATRFLSLAFGAAAHWGWESAGRILLRLGWYDTVYIAFCIALYCIAFSAARWKRNRSGSSIG